MISVQSQRETEICKLQEILGNLSEYDVSRALYRSKIAALLGNTKESAELSGSFVNKYSINLKKDRNLWNLLGEIAFLSRNFDAIERFIFNIFEQDVKIHIGDTQTNSSSCGVARWSLHNGKPTEFFFKEDLLRHSYMAIIIKHWIQSIDTFLYVKSKNPQKSGSALINLEDMGSEPGLAYCDFRAEYTLIPDPIFMQNNGYEDTKAAYNTDHIKWNDRRPSALWRGVTTGWYGNDGKRISGWRDLPRVKLAEIALESDRQDLDVGLTGIVQIQDQRAHYEIKSRGIVKPFMHWKEFQKFKYQIDIDGNSSSWPGLFIKLCTGSPVLKIKSPADFRQWYYDRLIPWVNYVPVESDMSDLVEKIEYLKNHDELAFLIGQNGLRLANSMNSRSEVILAEREIISAFDVGAQS